MIHIRSGFHGDPFAKRLAPAARREGAIHWRRRAPRAVGLLLASVVSGGLWAGLIGLVQLVLR